MKLLQERNEQWDTQKIYAIWTSQTFCNHQKQPFHNTLFAFDE